MQVFLELLLFLSIQAVTSFPFRGNTRIFDKNTYIRPFMKGRPFSKHPKARIETMITIEANNPPKATASIHAQSAYTAQLNAQVRSFYAKQTQFAECSNKRKCCYNKGLCKYPTFQTPKKQTQFQTHRPRTAQATINMQNKPNLLNTKMNLTFCGHHDYGHKIHLRTPPKQTQSNPICNPPLFADKGNCQVLQHGV